MHVHCAWPTQVINSNRNNATLLDCYICVFVICVCIVKIVISYIIHISQKVIAKCTKTANYIYFAAKCVKYTHLARALQIIYIQQKKLQIIYNLQLYTFSVTYIINFELLEYGSLCHYRAASDLPFARFVFRSQEFYKVRIGFAK